MNSIAYSRSKKIAMIKHLYLFLLFIPFLSSADVIDEPANNLDDVNSFYENIEKLADWHVSCEDNICHMELLFPYKQTEKVGLFVSYDIEKKKADHVGFILPSGTNSEKELLIKFLDNHDSDDSSPQSDSIYLPINNCNKEHCASVVRQIIASGDNSHVDLIDQLASHENIWMLFFRDGVAERAFIPIFNFRKELSEIKNADRNR